MEPNSYETYMRLALREAKAAFKSGEVPVGCVIVDESGHVVAKGRNRNAAKKNALHHAEIIAINRASARIGDFRLTGLTLFVTIEPCPMCAGAIIMSRISRVVYGAKNPKAGCAGSILDVLGETRFNHRAEVTGGVLADECGSLMTDYFRNR